ncbi:MAG: hypothetical protein ACKV2Q_30680 [Planctomycetaceae bacterium]
MNSFYRAVLWGVVVSLLYVGSSGPAIRLVPTILPPTWSSASMILT